MDFAQPISMAFNNEDDDFNGAVEEPDAAEAKPWDPMKPRIVDIPGNFGAKDPSQYACHMVTTLADEFILPKIKRGGAGSKSFDGMLNLMRQRGLPGSVESGPTKCDI